MSVLIQDLQPQTEAGYSTEKREAIWTVDVISGIEPLVNCYIREIVIPGQQIELLEPDYIQGKSKLFSTFKWIKFQLISEQSYIILEVTRVSLLGKVKLTGKVKLALRRFIWI